MAVKKLEENTTFIVSVENKRYCGEGAGGAQFAHGEAIITDKYLAEWFRTHEGYTVTEVEVKEETKKEA